MKTIPLTQGEEALVDDVDYARLLCYKWHTLRGRSGDPYAARSAHGGRSRRGPVLMHRQIMNPPPELEIDHINGNGLDNQRANLRIVTHVANGRNRRRCKPTRLGLPVGVQMATKCKPPRFQAIIKIDGHKIHLGMFATAEQAHGAYVAARLGSLAAAIKEQS